MERTTTEQHKRNRLEEIRQSRLRKRLERIASKYHRQTATPEYKPESTQCTHPLPAIKLQVSDTTEPEIKEFLSTIRDDDRRADVSAQCWIVRAEYPSAPAINVFNRALKVCQMVNKGIYSDRERKRHSKHGFPVSEYGEPMKSKAIRYWEAAIVECNRQERIEAAITIARSKLGEPLLQGMLAGRSKQEIADSLGITVSTLYRRLTALDVFRGKTQGPQRGESHNGNASNGRV